MKISILLDTRDPDCVISKSLTVLDKVIRPSSCKRLWAIIPDSSRILFFLYCVLGPTSCRMVTEAHKYFERWDRTNNFIIWCTDSGTYSCRPIIPSTTRKTQLVISKKFSDKSLSRFYDAHRKKWDWQMLGWHHTAVSKSLHCHLLKLNKLIF